MRLRATLLFFATAIGVLAPAGSAAGQEPEGATHLQQVTQLGLGFLHSCAVLESGQARCWGRNGRGQLGDGSHTHAATPVTVLNAAGTGVLNGVQQVAAGHRHTCAVLVSSQARCWGSNQYGQLGTGQGPADAVRPQVVLNPAGTGPLMGVVQIATGEGTSCAVLRSGQARCWGVGDEGERGDGTPIAATPPGRGDEVPPVPVSRLPVVVRDPEGDGPLTRVVAIGLTGRHACARLTSGQLRCWGQGYGFQLGEGRRQNRSLPVTVFDGNRTTPLTGIVQVDASSGGFTCARVAAPTSEVRCWGSQWNGALGDGSNGLQRWPNPVVARTGPGHLGDVVQITTGDAFSCARLAGGEARCWGQGGLGNGSEGEWNRPQVVVAPEGAGRLTGVRQIEAGGQHACAIVRNGEVRCWGRNQFGQTGNGDVSAWSLRPVAVLS